MRQYCIDCEWWETYDTDPNPQTGYCHRCAPSPYACGSVDLLEERLKESIQQVAPETYWQSRVDEYVKDVDWPRTACDQWCGEFKPKESEVPDGD